MSWPCVSLLRIFTFAKNLMKIIRHRLARRPKTVVQVHTTHEVDGVKPKKRALLVGINYDSAEHRPHHDVASMKWLLTERYGYDPQDVVVLIDKEEPGQVQPTRSNLLREIRNLVDGAQDGDKFFFHFAGHSTQIENKNNSERMEWTNVSIVPSDGVAQMITDNELRRHLVDTLPIGSTLTAIFDSCHLHLDHFRCNRVYVPWISKGKRRSDILWNANVRRHAIISSRHVYQSRRTSVNRVQSRRTSIDQLLVGSMDKFQSMTVKSLSLDIRSELEKWYDTPSSPIQRCASPDALYPCSGFCGPAQASSETAHVISLASCKDDQLTWEDKDGLSMTQVLIRILEDDPHPSLSELMTRVSHELHDASLNLHHAFRDFKKRFQEANKRRVAKGKQPLSSDDFICETDNFQDPQDMKAAWDP
ncbi:caspase domain-containing protein [Infundibulicybe gibba]|nr:caspase domain-containing protein [Infundibulicybe gibba]